MDDLNFTKLAIFGGAAFIVVVALLMFMGVIPSPSSQIPGVITGTTSIWLPKSAEFLEHVVTQDFKNAQDHIAVTITIVPDAEYDSRLVNALAAGTGPELWLLPHDRILTHRDKVATIPFTTIPERTYLDTFIDEGELFLVPADLVNKKDGYAIALPVLVDPLVLFWNKDLLGSAGVARPPQTWDEFVTAAKTLTTLDANGNFTQSGVALGEFGNIANAKDIISLLILQAGNPIIEKTTLEVALDRQSGALTPTASAIRFFNEFSNPRKDDYSWNHLRPEALDAFAAQKLALYIGYASEYADIIKKNPHLNFDVAEVPQIKGDTTTATYGRLTGIAISKSAAKSGPAMALATYLAGSEAQKQIASTLERPSVRRDVLSASGQNARLTVYSRAAVKARGWLDPAPDATYEIFRKMVESVKTGAKDPQGAITNAKNELQSIVPNK
ncbi:MAG: extracellular solute-binding protein [Candidatus Niyogibacteria bacterium]|nr:extracellular solute-binding protein [Candidatus Niyogibacteria bacterium]